MLNWNAAAPSKAIAAAARVLLTPRGGGLEGFGGNEGGTGTAVVTEKERVQRLAEHLRSEAAKAGDEPGDELRRRVIEGAKTGLAKVNSGADPSSYTVADQIGLESVILTGGERPSLYVRKNSIDFNAPDIGDWRGDLWRVKNQIERVARSVGRISVPVQPYFAGTCFVIGDGLVLTNRHVLEEIATSTDGRTWALKWPKETFIDFVGEDGNAALTRFLVKGLRVAGPDMINRAVNFAHLDIAVLDVDPASDAENRFPERLSFDANAARPGAGQNVYVMGFPGKPRVWQFDGTPPVQFEASDVLNALFNNRFGVKRLAPGGVKWGAGQVSGDSKKWIFAHDASTLNGNSGSCVVDLSGEGATVVGLHFAGVNREQNWAHVAAMVQSYLVNHGVPEVTS